MWSVIQSRRQSSRCLTRNAQARSNVREKCFRTQTGRFKSVSSEIPPENVCLKYSTVQLTLNIFTNGKKKKEGKGEIKPSTCACTTVVVVEGRRNKKKEKKWRIVVKLRRKQRSRWNNAMFHARRLTFPRNNEVNKKNSYILNGNALYNPG